MAQVPLNGELWMFDGEIGVNATSIHEVLKHEFGYNGDSTFVDMIDFIQLNCSISDFRPEFRPNSILEINETKHFRGFPFHGLGVIWNPQQIFST